MVPFKKSTFTPFLILSLFVIMVSCNPAGGEKKDQVEIKTDGIFTEPTVNFLNGNDLGEFLVDSDTVIVVPVRITNKSKHGWFNMSFDLDRNSDGFFYRKNEEDSDPGYPGQFGTCGPTLAAGAQCLVYLQYEPSKAGDFKQLVTLNYTNIVSPESVDYEMYALTGEAASMIFIDDVAIYNHGVVEQTEPPTITTEIVLKNAGGLSAKNLSFQIIKESPVDPEPAGFNITANDCPLELRPGETCNISITYLPLNNLEADPEIEYKSNFRVNYVNDPFGTLAFLNGYWSSLSTKIQGVFNTNLPIAEFKTNDGENPVVGNVITKSVKVTNIGYREGILLEAIFKHSTYGTGTDNEWAICTKPSTPGDYMDCKDPLGNPIGVSDLFPWKIKDTTGCMEAETAGIVGDNTQGDSCFFEIFFHPSTTLAYNADHTFNNTKIDFKYDSRWKGNVTIIQDEYFSLYGEAKGAGRLAIDSFSYNGSGLPEDKNGLLDIIGEDVWRQYDAGRVALVSSASYFTPFDIRVKNIGNSPVSITKLRTFHQLDPIQNIVNIGASDTNVNLFYDKLSTTCFASDLAPGQVCTMQGRFIPLHQGNEPANDNMAYDLDLGTGKVKTFTFSYTDGTSVEDDALSARPERLSQTRFTMAMVAKGFLAYDASRPISDGLMGNTIVDGLSDSTTIKLINVGTAGIPYIKIKQFDSDNPTNLYRYDMFPPSNPNNMGEFPFTFEPTPASWLSANPGYIDCLPLIDKRSWQIDSGTSNISITDGFAIDTFDFNKGTGPLVVDPSWTSPDPTWELPSEGKCGLTIKAEHDDPKQRTQNNFVAFGVESSLQNGTFTERAREYRVDLAGSDPMKLRYANPWRNLGQPQPISFEYFDGDFVGRGPSDPDPADLDNYGDLHVVAPGSATKDDEYAIGINFQRPSIVIPVNPTPHTSGIIYRPGFTYPQLGVSGEPWYMDLENITENWDYTNYSSSGSNTAPGVMAWEAKTVAKTAHDPTAEYTFHMGTFPINTETYYARFSLTNYENRIADPVHWDFETPDAANPIQFEAGAPQIADTIIPRSQFKTITFKFNPTTAGEFSRILTYDYFNGFETVTKRVKVVAVGIGGDYPTLAFDQEDYNVTYDPVSGANEALSGSRVGINSYLNRIQSGVYDAEMTTVRRGTQDAEITIYAKKRLYLKNDTIATPIKNIRVYWKGSATTSSPDNNMANIGVATSVLTTACSDTNEDLPAGGECIIDITYTPFISQSPPVRVLSISYEINTGQFVETNIQVRFTPLNPANVTVPSLAAQPTFDQNSIPRSSYPLNWGNVTLQNYPATVPPEKVVTVQNSSTLAASFIKQWQCFQEEQNPINNGGTSCVTDINNDGTDEFDPSTVVTSQDVGDTSTPVLIYDKFGVQVRATHECFYGDDVYTGDPSDEDKGFSSSVSIACQLRFRYSADETYVMEKIGSSDTMVRLSYYDFKRNSFNSKLWFHPSGFIIPNGVVSGGFTTVTANDGGTIYLEWDDMVNNAFPSNPNWGPITGYKVFGASSSSTLSGTKIYTSQSLADAAADTTDSFLTITSGTITGLLINPGNYYFFKIAAKRTINGKDYYVDSGMITVKVLVPPLGTIFDYGMNILVDKNFHSTLKTLSDAKSYCLTEKYNYSDSGTPIQKSKKLIDTNIHTFIKADPLRSDYTYYAVPHWLADNPTDISPIFGACKAYDPTKQSDVCSDYPSGETPTAYLTYFKSCPDTSCDNLYKVYGTINATNEQFYTDDPTMTFYPRCFTNL